MKVLQWPQHIPHCKSLVTIPDAQGQLSPQSQVKAGRNSNSSKLLWLSSLPEKMKRLQSKIKALVCYKFEHQFSDAQGQLTP